MILNWRHGGRAMRKHVLGYMRLTKVQIKLNIRAVWSGPLRSANRMIGYYRMYKLRASRKHTYNILTPLNPTFI